MSIRKYILLIPVICFCLFSCGEENLNNIAANQFVVEAFIFAGEPIQDIRIKSTFPLTDEVDTSSPIDDASVTIIKNGQRFDLVSSGGDGLYHYPGDDVVIATNDVFQLEIVYNGITAFAETTVPTPTIGLEISQDTLLVPQLPLSEGRDAIVQTIGNFLRGSMIEATWDNPNEDLYYMVVESVIDTVDPIFPTQVLEALSDFRFVSEPVDDNSLTFFAGSLVSFGQYSVKVYHINQEYAALFENREQDSRDLNEPPSNVINALGVFSAFNSQEAFFEVVRE
jgi:hypothetical protein